MILRLKCKPEECAEKFEEGKHELCVYNGTADMHLIYCSYFEIQTARLFSHPFKYFDITLPDKLERLYLKLYSEKAICVDLRSFVALTFQRNGTVRATGRRHFCLNLNNFI